MKHKGERSKALMLMAIALFLAQLTAPCAASQQAGEITGVITDGLTDGWSPNFIAGATIRLYSLDRILQMKTDVKGRFRLKNVPGGNYELEVSASGFKTKTIDQVKVNDSSNLNYEVPLNLASPGCEPLDKISYESSAEIPGLVQGVIVDAGSAQTPLRGVEVRLFHTSDKPTSQQTNERGEFRFNVREPGRYFIQIKRPGYQTAQSQQFWVRREGRTVVKMRQVKVGWLIACE